MSWEAIGALAELFGALAVVVSLLVLARQIRESNRVARGEAIRARGERMVDIWLRVAENPTLGRLTRDAFFAEMPLDSFAAEDRQTWHMVVRALVHLWESEYIENRDGEFDDDVWRRRVRTIAGMVETKPAYRAIWEELQPILTDGFVAEIERARAEIRATDAVEAAGIPGAGAALASDPEAEAASSPLRSDAASRSGKYSTPDRTSSSQST